MATELTEAQIQKALHHLRTKNVRCACGSAERRIHRNKHVVLTTTQSGMDGTPLILVACENCGQVAFFESSIAGANLASV